MTVGVRLGLVVVLGLIGLAGLVQLPLKPPMFSRSGAGTTTLLADLDSLEAQLDQRQEASVLLYRFVGAEITRYFWGGFSGYLDVLGIEEPDGMAAKVSLDDQSVQLRLSPPGVAETFVARVEAIDGVPRGVVCRGKGTPAAFPFRASRLECPSGWRPLPNIKAPSLAGAASSF
jgi:hypothetical protein